MEGLQGMAAVDRAWLLMERPTNPMMVVCLIVVGEPLAYRRLCEIVAQRFLAFERFRCRPVNEILEARWIPQEDFDVHDHLVRVALPGAADQQDLETLVGELSSTPLSPQRPLWSFHLVEHYRGGSALIVRIHHCYADGIALVRVLLSLADGTPQNPPPAASPAPSPSSTTALVPHMLGATAGLVERAVHFALNPGETAGMAGAIARIATLSDDPRTCLKRALSGVRHVAWCEPFPFEELRTIARLLGCTINDLLVAALAGALGRYLQSRGEVVDAMTLRAAVPVNLRAQEDPSSDLGNRFGLVFLELPVGIRHPLERLYAVHAMMQKLKGSAQALVTLGLLAVVGSLPAALEEPVIALFSAKASLVTSNVPGPRERLYLGGVPITQTLFWVPQAGSIGLGISMLSYAGEVQLGVMADRALIAEPRELAGLMRAELENVVLLVLMGAATLSP